MDLLGASQKMMPLFFEARLNRSAQPDHEKRAFPDPYLGKIDLWNG